MTPKSSVHRHTAGNLLQRVAAVAVLGVAACSSSENKTPRAADSADGAASVGAPATGGVSSAATPAAMDTGMAGMDHSSMPGMAMNRSTPRDSTQAFLRMMSDHHEGLMRMADSAAGRVQTADAKMKAREMTQKQQPEQQQMLTMLRREYQDSVTPMVMPSNRAMIDSVVRGAQGGGVDRVFYRQVIAHHREATQMVDQMLPQLTGEVRSMAQRMRREQQAEIQELERKASQGA